MTNANIEDDRVLTKTTTLTSADATTIANALGVAAEQFKGHVEMFRDLAERLRAGHKEPMFAEGENGARAAERLAEQFQMQTNESYRLQRMIWEADTVVLTVDDD